MIPDTLKALVVPIGTLRPYARNPRNGDTEAIRASLRANGQYRPLVVNQRTSEILAGNHTYAAALEEGWSEIAVTYVDADDDQAARIVLVDNRTNDMARYDEGLLARLLEEQPTLEGTGYAQADLDDLLARVNASSAALVGDASADVYRAQYGVIVMCAGEGEQQTVYECLLAQGYTVKVVVT